MPANFRGLSWKWRRKDLPRAETVDRQAFWQEREAAHRAALTFDPSLTDIWVQYGHALKEQGQLDAAEEAYRRSLALDAALADTHLQLGHALKLQRRTGDAADAYLTAHRLDPDLPDPAIELRALGLELPTITRVEGEAGADDRSPSIGHAHGLSVRVEEIFDFRYYFYANPVVQDAVGKLDRHRCLLHFCSHGIGNVLQCNADLLFDADFYCEAYLPWRLSASNAYWHWLNVGFDRGWHPGRVAWLKDILGWDLAAHTRVDFAPCRAFFYGNDRDAKWTDLFKRFLDGEVLRDGPHLPVTPETADFFAAVADRFAFGNDDAALSLYERVLVSVPHHRHALLNYADCLQRKRLFLQAAAIHAGIIQRNEASIWCFLHRATCCVELGDFHQALACLESGIERFPGVLPLRDRFNTVAGQLLARAWQVAFAIGLLGRYGEAQSRMREAYESVSSKMTVSERLPHQPIRSVAIVGNLEIPQCYFYRIEQKVEHLEAAGYSVTVYNFHNQLHQFVSDVYKYQSVIFYRVPSTIPVLAAIRKATELGLVTFYDMDDLLFYEDSSSASYESYLGQITREDYVGIKLEVPMYRHAISVCDYAIAPTSALAAEMAKIVSSGRAFVHRNAFGRAHERFAMDSPAARGGKRVTIFYGSGTKRHKEDFRDLVEPALVEIVKRYGPLVHVVLAGDTVTSEAGRIWYVNPTIPAEALESIRQNITVIDPLWDIDEYWALLQSCDINLAVLKQNLITDCKSEIKWMEAAMFGIPSVVSGSATHREVVEHGVTGLICDTPEEWIDALDLLVRDEEMRRRIGLAARQLVHDAYNIPRMAESLSCIFAQTAHVAPSPPKPTIVIVNTSYPPQAVGEATRIVHDNVRYLAKTFPNDFQIEIFTTGWGKQDYEIACHVCDGVRVTAVHLPLSTEIAQADQDERVAQLFAEYLDRVDPALIHFHGIQRLTVSVVSAGLARGTPWLISAHDGWWISDQAFIVNDANEPILYDYGDPPATALKWGAAAYDRLMQLKGPLLGASKILGGNDKIADLYRRCGVPNVITLANGVPDIREKVRATPRDGRVRLGFLGSLEHVTGFDLIKYALLAREFEHLRLTIVDAGLEAGSSRQEVWSGTPVDFVPEIPDDRLAELYANIDVLLAPTVWFESSGLAARQALCCGCWVVGSDRANLGDCVTHGENGYVIDVSDARELIGVLSLIDSAPRRYFETPPARPEMRRSSEQGDELAGLYRSIIASQCVSAASAPSANLGLARAAVQGRVLLDPGVSRDT
jgi:glycosyltransferase involved in cell wall biosynthesis